MDELEKYIAQHRNEFDIDEPKDDLWEKINATIQKPEPKRKWLTATKTWQVAAVVLLLATSWLAFDKFYFRGSETATENSVLSEFREVEQYYMGLVADKRKALEEQAADDPEYKKEFLGELDELDVQYQRLHDNLKFGNQEEVVNAMIMNLRLRLEILSRQLEILEEINKTEDERYI